MVYLNGREVNVTKFPNGESLIKFKLEDYLTGEMRKLSKHFFTVSLKFESDSDITTLIFLKKQLDDERSVEGVTLIMPYIPYSRMDRTEGTVLFTLKYFAQIINSLNFDSVFVNEAHSNVSLALFDRIVDRATSLDLLGMETLDKRGDYVVFFPDEGAYKRYSKKVKKGIVLHGEKTRDFATGEIKGLRVVGDAPTKPFKAYIVDDLCSGGRTFIESGKALKSLGAESVTLLVTHCEKTILQGDIATTNFVDRVITTNSIISNDDIVGTPIESKMFIKNLFYK